MHGLTQSSFVSTIISYVAANIVLEFKFMIIGMTMIVIKLVMRNLKINFHFLEQIIFVAKKKHCRKILQLSNFENVMGLIYI